MIGDRIKEARINNSLTQRKLSELSGINQPRIVQYETGKSVPGMKNLERLAQALGVSRDFLRSSGKVSSRNDIPIDDNDYQRKLRSTRAFTASEKKLVADVIDVINKLRSNQNLNREKAKKINDILGS